MRVVVRAAVFTLGLVFSSSLGFAQIAQTGPAALARQMPTIYGPYLANISRVRILGKRNGSASSTSRVPNGPSTSGSSGQTRSNPQPVIVKRTFNLHDTSFTPVQGPFVPQQLARVLGGTSQERQSIQDTLTKCLDFYTESAKQKGVPLNDVSLALNYYLSTNYFVYSRGSGPTTSQMTATRDMIRQNLVQDTNFRQMSDRDKQQSYETLIVLAGFVDLGYGAMKQNSNDGGAEQFRDMARHNLETLLGAPISKIHYTDSGLTVE